MRSGISRFLLAVFFTVATIFSGAAQGQPRILIAYFTWAENTVILDRARAVREANNHVFSMESGLSADAVTTASVVPPGNTATLASWIREFTGGDMFSIQVKDSYPCYWDECLDRASEEKARGARPELKGMVDDISEYDIVFLGFPTWWYTIPMAVANFVESHDLSDKKIVPFVSHGTSGIARTIRDLKKLLPASATVAREIGVYRSQTSGARDAVEDWLRENGYAD